MASGRRFYKWKKLIYSPSISTDGGRGGNAIKVKDNDGFNLFSKILGNVRPELVEGLFMVRQAHHERGFS